jgi:N-acetylglucosaminyl-diphospho-decaprenol L-rhamnosyltransferase
MAPAERTVGWLSGSCLLLRRAAFDEVGGFDPAYFMYFEDTDLGDRFGRAGWKNVYMPEAVATHVGGHATRREPARMQAAHHDSALRYLSRRYAAWWWFPLRLALRGGLAVRAALARKVPSIGEGARPMRSAPPKGQTRSRSRK